MAGEGFCVLPRTPLGGTGVVIESPVPPARMYLCVFGGGVQHCASAEAVGEGVDDGRERQ